MKSKLLTLLLCATCFVHAQVSKTNNTSEFGIPSGSSIQRNFAFTAQDFSGQVGSNISNVTIELVFDVMDLTMFGFAEHENIAFQLVSPNNTAVDLIYDTDGVFSGANSGATYTAGADANNVEVTLDDAASVQPSFEPITGTFKPEEPLSAFTGENAIGTWTLNIGHSGFSFDTEFSFQSATINIVPAPCIVNIPDANLKAELIFAGNGIDTNANGEIECAEAIAFTGSLFLGSLNIADATGLEAFINITELQIQGNNLTQLDLSNNLKIQTLSCTSNNINNLIIGSNTDITFIEAGSNNLSSFSVSGLSNLESLDVSFNTSLSTFSVSGSSNLKTLVTADTDISNISFVGLTSLETITTNNCKLTALDVSGLPNLVSLNCSNNQLTSLNVQNGNNANMGSIFALPLNATGNPNLNCIQIDAGFTPGSDWLKDSSASFNSNCGTLSLDNNEIIEVKVYPNPTQDILSINVFNFNSISIYNLEGKAVLFSQNPKVDVSHLSSGMYIMKIQSKNGTATKRFMKK